MLGLLLALIPVLPFLSFAFLVIFGARLPRVVVATVGVGMIGIDALLALALTAGYISAPPPGGAFSQTLWTWLRVGDLSPGITFYLDALSLTMVVVVTFVGFLIHLYSAQFMLGDEGYARFFAYMNLFVGSMLTLLLGDNLLLLYLGWEGVGLCSYLLIGFYYRDPANGNAGRKAFVVTRVGDTSLGIGLFLLYTTLGTLNIQPLMQRAAQEWAPGTTLPVVAALLLLGGAVGKSAQLPLQTWLPDAMAGPTPVSALLHAATMVTAGVYLIARTHVLFALAPLAQAIVAIIGALTLLLAGFSALTQHDIKRVLAYSTMSQIGYMFLALGVGAWSAAIFHFWSQAFFKALLFLGAGIVILAMHEEHDMFKMGGLRKALPLTFWTFLIASCSLAALPLVTAGFYSKDRIIAEAWTSQLGSPVLWLAGVVGAFITTLYTFRMVFLTFFGAQKVEPHFKPGLPMTIPLVVLAVLSIAGGWFAIPQFLGPVLPEPALAPGSGSFDILSQIVTALTFVAGVGLTYYFYIRAPQAAASITHTPWAERLQRWWYRGWGFDRLYDILFVHPFMALAREDKDDAVDSIYTGIADVCRGLYRGLSLTETGQMRWYAMGIAAGAVITIAVAVLLWY